MTDLSFIFTRTASETVKWEVGKCNERYTLMKTTIKTAASKTLTEKASRSVIQKQLGLDPARSQLVIDRSLDCFMAELGNLSADDIKVRGLHTGITGADTSFTEDFTYDNRRLSSLESSRKQLESLLGSDSKTRLSKALIRDATLTQSQADDALGFVSPAVIDAIKSAFNNGSVANTATGLKAALRSSDNTGAVTPSPATTPTTAKSTTSPTTSTAANVATSTGSGTSATGQTYVAGTVAEPQSSWLMRFGLPIFLLGALVLGSIRYCSNAEESRVVTEERDQLQLNLASAEEQNTKTSEELAALQTDYEKSQSTTETLESDLQSTQLEFETLTTEHGQLQEELVAAQSNIELNTTEINSLKEDLSTSRTEVAKLQDLPQDAAGLQQNLIGTMQERDDALSAKAKVLETLETVEADRDSTQEKNNSLQFDIKTAKKNILSNATLITGLRSQIGELSTQRDEIENELTTTSQNLEKEKADVDQLTTEVSDLEDRVGDLTASIKELDGEIVSLNDQKATLEDNLQATQGSLDTEREERQSDNNSLTAQAESLQEQLANLTIDRDTKVASLTERASEIEKQAETINELQQKVETLEAEKVQAEDSGKLLNEQIAELENENSQMQKLIEARDTSLAESASELDATSKSLTTAQAEIKQLEEKQSESLAMIDDINIQASLLKQDKSDAVSEIESKDKINAGLSQELQALKVRYDDATGEIEQLTQGNEQLDNELAQATALNTDLQSNIDALTEQNAKLDMAGKDFSQSLSDSDEEIAKLIEARDKLQSEVAGLVAESYAITSETEKVREAIARKLSDAGLADVHVNSIENNSAVSITLGSNILFSAGDVTMSGPGSKVLREVGRAVSDYQDWHIDVEGHTDSLPIGEQLKKLYPSNWELSSARASAVINHLRFASGVKAGSMSARGFADTQPVADNSSASGRKENRRVDIVLRR